MFFPHPWERRGGGLVGLTWLEASEAGARKNPTLSFVAIGAAGGLGVFQKALVEAQGQCIPDCGFVKGFSCSGVLQWGEPRSRKGAKIL